MDFWVKSIKNDGKTCLLMSDFYIIPSCIKKYPLSLLISFGYLLFQVIATCSFDRTAAVWEEIAGEKTGVGQNHWIRKTSLVDSR